MKRLASLTLALLLSLSLSACGGEASSKQSDSVPSEPVSSIENNVEQSSVEETDTAEEKIVSPTMVSGENSVSVVVGEDVLVEFTLPTETPIYDKLQHSAGDKYAMLIHAVMETSVSGRTIVEVIEGTLMDFDDALKNMVSTDDAITGELKELDGKEVYIFKKLEKEVNTFETEVCSFEYLVDIPLNENIILQFRIDGAYNPENTVVFDDSIIDILLSHCVF
ncbi:MAG TPA: hypothetical protein DF364_05895 [Ruminococcaceae bacterium]|nr:hypothetical protein [Oscillospiraceae bacterium]